MNAKEFVVKWSNILRPVAGVLQADEFRAELEAIQQAAYAEGLAAAQASQVTTKI